MENFITLVALKFLVWEPESRRVDILTMNPWFIAVILLEGLAILLLLLFRKPSRVGPSGNDSAPNVLVAIDQGLRKLERFVSDEVSRNRQEQSAQSQSLRSEVVTSLIRIGESVSTNVESLTRTNDQKLELLRSGIEQRLDSFTTDSGRKVDGLSQSVSASFLKLEEAVSIKLAEFTRSLEETTKDGHKLQRETTETVAGTMTSLKSSLDERQLGLQKVIDKKLSDIGQQTGQKLSEVESALRTQSQQLREEASGSFKNLGDTMLGTMTGISDLQKSELRDLNTTLDGRLASIQAENEKKLEQMRQTVDEKLQGTLEARLGESFKQVSDRLEQVHKGLGEMQTLAAGVGDLKRVLTNVKTRGTWGEVQLGALLEQVLASDQYGRNVATSGTSERVEFAVRLPGHDKSDMPIWLPIDAKFPIEDYQRIVEASEKADVDAVEKASKQLETTLKLCAKNMSEKYLAPPATTDFGILFLPTEGLYAEAIRRTGLAELIQRQHRILLAGPSTLAALLNTLQMGFRTLAIQQRSSEVWELLGAVKSEFGKYAGVLSKVKKKLSEAQNTIDSAETRTRAIHKKLHNVENSENPFLIPEGLPTDGDGEEPMVLAAVAGKI